MSVGVAFIGWVVVLLLFDKFKKDDDEDGEE
jgi:hypothetical protein